MKLSKKNKKLFENKSWLLLYLIESAIEFRHDLIKDEQENNIIIDLDILEKWRILLSSHMNDLSPEKLLLDLEKEKNDFLIIKKILNEDMIELKSIFSEDHISYLKDVFLAGEEVALEKGDEEEYYSSFMDATKINGYEEWIEYFVSKIEFGNKKDFKLKWILIYFIENIETLNTVEINRDFIFELKNKIHNLDIEDEDESEFLKKLSEMVIDEQENLRFLIKGLINEKNKLTKEYSSKDWANMYSKYNEDHSKYEKIDRYSTDMIMNVVKLKSLNYWIPFFQGKVKLVFSN